jgi:hypothetical protein
MPTLCRVGAGEKILKGVPKNNFLIYKKPENQRKNFQSPTLT